MSDPHDAPACEQTPEQQRTLWLEELSPYPRIKDAIERGWGTPYLEESFREWSINGRDRPRDGFKASAGQALIQLGLAHTALLLEKGLAEPAENPLQWNPKKWILPKNF